MRGEMGGCGGILRAGRAKGRPGAQAANGKGISWSRRGGQRTSVTNDGRHAGGALHDTEGRGDNLSEGRDAGFGGHKA